MAMNNKINDQQHASRWTQREVREGEKTVTVLFPVQSDENKETPSEESKKSATLP